MRHPALRVMPLMCGVRGGAASLSRSSLNGRVMGLAPRYDVVAVVIEGVQHPLDRIYLASLHHLGEHGGTEQRFVLAVQILCDLPLRVLGCAREAGLHDVGVDDPLL